MPAIMSAKDSEGKTYSYKLYTKAEIERIWKTYGGQHISNIKNGKPYIMCKVNDGEEGIVLAALIMRETDAPPVCVVYIDELKRVVVNCKFIGIDFEKMKEDCKFITSIYSSLTNLRFLRYDLAGEPLFRDLNAEAANFYKNKNFPYAKISSVFENPYTPKLGNIHEHIHPSLAGII